MKTVLRTRPKLVIFFSKPKTKLLLSMSNTNEKNIQKIAFSQELEEARGVFVPLPVKNNTRKILLILHKKNTEINKQKSYYKN